MSNGPELIYHDFRAPSDYTGVERAQARLPIERIEVDWLLTEEAVSFDSPSIALSEFLDFARANQLALFIHLVDASVYTPRALALFRQFLQEQDIPPEDTIVGSTNIPGLIELKRVIPTIRNQCRFPTPGIDYVHCFGPDLLRRIEGLERREWETNKILERLFDIHIPPGQDSAYRDRLIITTFDAFDKRSGREIGEAIFRQGLRTLTALPWLDLLISNGTKSATYVDILAQFPFRQPTRFVL